MSGGGGSSHPSRGYRGRAEPTSTDRTPVSQRPSAVVVLAAGEGTRMKSALPKVLHRILGRPLLGHVLAASAALDPELTVVVVGHGRDAVTAHLTESDPTVRVVVQERQLGTGHAVRTALDVVAWRTPTAPVVVLAGDAPLITSETLLELLAAHDASGSAATVLSARLDDPTGYGRVVRGGGGRGARDRRAEGRRRRAARDPRGQSAASSRSRRGPLRDALRRIGTDNVAGEEYLTDVLGLLRGRRPGRRRGGRGQRRRDPRRQRPGPARAGPGAAARPDRGALDARGRDRRRPAVRPGSASTSRSRPTVSCTRTPSCTGAPTWRGWRARRPRHHAARRRGRGRAPGCGARRRPRHGSAPARRSGRSRSCARARCSPPAPRSARTSRRRTRVVGEGSKVPHLSYVGDATIGAGSNIGAATVFVNYDGVDKHRTVVGDHVRVGQRHDARRPADDRGRRLHGRRLGDHRRRPTGRDGRRSRPPAQRRGLGRAQACRVRGRARRSAGRSRRESSGTDQAADTDVPEGAPRVTGLR